MCFVIHFILRLACDPDSQCLGAPAGGEPFFGLETGAQMPKEIRLEGSARQNMGDGSVQSMQIISGSAVIESPLYRVDDSGAERIHAKIAVIHSGANRVEGSRRVDPVRNSNDSLIAKDKFLPAGPDRKMALLQIPKLYKGLPEIERVLIRSSRRDGIVPQYAGILRLRKYAQPGKSHIHV